MAASGSIAIDQPGKYPIVLSDALLGRPSKEIYTSIRYNHKPNTSSDSSSTSMHLGPSDSDSSGFDLSYTDDGDKYNYHGAQSSAEGKYVLIFDPVKEHFVLHRVDSTFDMNLVSVPWAQDEAGLRSQYPQLDTQRPKAAAPLALKRRPSKSKTVAAVAKSEPLKKKKVEKVTKPKPPPEPTPEEEEEEESDDGLTIEYPDAPDTQEYTYQSTPIFQRQASEEPSEEDSDAEGEEYEDELNQDVDHLKLPSPANNLGGLSDEDIEADLEAELEQAFQEEAESSESEEE